MISLCIHFKIHKLSWGASGRVTDPGHSGEMSQLTWEAERELWAFLLRLLPPTTQKTGKWIDGKWTIAKSQTIMGFLTVTFYFLWSPKDQMKLIWTLLFLVALLVTTDQKILSFQRDWTQNMQEQIVVWEGGPREAVGLLVHFVSSWPSVSLHRSSHFNDL